MTELLTRLRAKGMQVRPRQTLVRFGCLPSNESDFCTQCGASFSVGLPLVSEKEKQAIRARLADEWRMQAITAGGFLR